MTTYIATTTSVNVPEMYKVLRAKTLAEITKKVEGKIWSYKIEEVERAENRSPYVLFCEANNLPQCLKSFVAFQKSK